MNTQRQRFNDCPTSRAIGFCIIAGGLVMWAIANAIIEIAAMIGAAWS